jgi:hypothetical protein
MKTMKIYFLALVLACMAGCSYDPSDITGGGESNVLDPSKGFDSQGKEGLVYGKVTCSGTALKDATVYLHTGSSPGFPLGEPAVTDDNGMYGVRFDVTAFVYNVYIDVNDTTNTCADIIDELAADVVNEGESVRKNVALL